MNKQQLIKTMSRKTNLTQRECLSCLNSIKEAIIDSLKRGEKVSFSGFGRFEVKQRNARKVVNPATKQVNFVPPKRIPVFKTGKNFASVIR